MKVLAFIVAATIFEAVGDAVMRIALHYHVMPGRTLLFASATVLLAMYGAALNLAPIEFASATGIYLASLFIAFQVVNYVFFRHTPGPGVLLGGTFIVAGAAIIFAPHTVQPALQRFVEFGLPAYKEFSTFKEYRRSVGFGNQSCYAPSAPFPRVKNPPLTSSFLTF